LTKHLGSIALGSFLIALVELVRILFEYYAKKLEKAGTNKVTEILLKCTRYLLDCFERVIRFLTENAYIMIAITGSNFCMSAKKAFGLIFTNSMRFGAVALMGKVFYIMGVTVISGSNGLVVYAAITQVDTWKEKTIGWVGPVLIGFIEGLIAGVMYMGMFSFSADTILMCFLVDEDEKRPGDNRPSVISEFVQINDENIPK
jgi:solute carrier family 44 (choline transporter-like protein), member 2/4/5